IRFGSRQNAQIRLLRADLRSDHSSVAVAVNGEPIEYEVPLPGRAMIMNSLAVLASAVAVGADWQRAAHDLASYESQEGRLRRYQIPIHGGQFELIDDSYNAEQLSMAANFEVLGLAEPGPGGRRLAALGRIVHLAEAAAEMHAELAQP